MEYLHKNSKYYLVAKVKKEDVNRETNFGFKMGDFPNAEEFYKEEVSLPIYYDLNQNQQLKVINVIKRILKNKKN